MGSGHFVFRSSLMKRNLLRMCAFFIFTMVFTACGDEGNVRKCDTQNPCTNGMICIEQNCVDAQCSLTKTCDGREQICNDLGKCVLKSDKLECSTMHPCADAQSCDKGLCKKDVVDKSCNPNKKCTAEGEICNEAGMCVPKLEIFDCGTQVKVTDFGAVGDADFFKKASGKYFSDGAFIVPATDATDAINDAIAHAVASGNLHVCIPPGNYLIQPVGERTTWEFEHSSRGGIRMKSGVTLTLSPDTALVMNPTDASGYAFISIDNQHDVTVRGGKIVGDVEHHIGDKHNYCYGINIANASRNVLIENMDISRCEDDGLMVADYVAEPSGHKRTESITIRGVNSHHNGRQGLSLTTGSEILIEGNTFSYQTKHAPMSGIDIELESYDFVGVSNVSIINNTFIGNAFAAVIISDMFNDTPASLSHNILISGNTVEAVQLGLVASGWVDGLEISDNDVKLTCLLSMNCSAFASTSGNSNHVVIKNNTATSDNSVKNYTVGVLSINDTRTIITGNTLFGQDMGIVLSGNDALVSGNTISGAQTKAIETWDGTHSVSDNKIIP